MTSIYSLIPGNEFVSREFLVTYTATDMRDRLSGKLAKCCCLTLVCQSVLKRFQLLLRVRRGPLRHVLRSNRPHKGSNKPKSHDYLQKYVVSDKLIN